MSVHIEAKEGEIAERFYFREILCELNILRRLFWKIQFVTIRYAVC
ncbi:Uncharacterised protein [Enterococcus faecium]|nr:Uncharacterised protein [Enterococcus faecium]